MKPLFGTGYSLNVRLFLCVAASLVLLGMEHHGRLAAARSPLATLVYPLQKLVSAPNRFVHDLIDNVSRYGQLGDENRRLRDDLLVLRTRQLKFDALEQENIRLRGLLDTSFKVGEQVLIAELLSINLVPYEHVVVVNKGSRFGVYPGQAVFDGNGVVGQVLRVTPYSSEVVLITDPSHAIPVQVNRNGVRTIAQGTGRLDRLALPYLPSNADVQVGDLLVTSGLGGGFPAGYPVARVTAIAPDKNPFGKISAVPAAQLDRNRELLLVWSNSQPIPRIPDALPAPTAPPDGHAKR
jgi:rod shape-determining protein MreC